jgi:hypothetical protein
VQEGAPPNGLFSVQYSVNDGNGQSSNCSVTFLFLDNDPPTFTCPPDLTVRTDGNNLCQVPTPNLITGITDATDNCSTADLAQNPVAGALQTGIPDGGTFQVTLFATDLAGNVTDFSCKVTVTVLDDDSPVVACPPANITVSTNPVASCEITIPDYIDLLVPTDNCTGTADLLETQNPQPGSYVVSGDGALVTVLYLVSDGALTPNYANCVVFITANDVDAPTFTCPADATVSSSASGNCAVTVPNLVAGISDASDNCGTLHWMQTPAAGTVLDGLVFGSTIPIAITLSDGNGNTNIAPCALTLTLAPRPRVPSPRGWVPITDTRVTVSVLGVIAT